MNTFFHRRVQKSRPTLKKQNTIFVVNDLDMIESSVSDDDDQYQQYELYTSSEPIKCPSPSFTVAGEAHESNVTTYEDDLDHYNTSTWLMYHRIMKYRKRSGSPQKKKFGKDDDDKQRRVSPSTDLRSCRTTSWKKDLDKKTCETEDEDTDMETILQTQEEFPEEEIFHLEL